MLSVLLFFIRAAASAFFIKKCVVSDVYKSVGIDICWYLNKISWG